MRKKSDILITSDSLLYTRLLMACSMKGKTITDNKPVPKMVFRADEETAKLPCPGNAMTAVQASPQTFIMRWNPAISSHKLTDFTSAMQSFFNDGFYYEWSIYDHLKACIGDTFYMLRVGEGTTGIVMRGVIAEEPFRDEDWSGRNRETWYVRMLPECMIHPEKGKLITTEELQKDIPSLNWNEGHSGVLISSNEAVRLERIWEKYMEKLTSRRKY